MYWSRADVPADEVGHIWEITKDFIETADRESPGPDHDPTTGFSAGTCGPSQYDDVKARFDKLPEGALTRVKFRLLDDDKNVYYEGVLTYQNDFDDFDEPYAAPLEDFGTPMAGAVILQEWQENAEHVCEHCGSKIKGRWVTVIA